MDTAKAPFTTWNYKTTSVFCPLSGGKLANPKLSTLTVGREVATASKLSSWQLCSERLSFHSQMLTNLAIIGKICNFPCPTFPVSMGRAQTDLKPTPRYFSHGKQEQMPSHLPARDICSVSPATVLLTQGSVCLTRCSCALNRCPDHSRGDAASGRVSRAIPQLDLLCNSSIPAARGTHSHSSPLSLQPREL